MTILQNPKLIGFLRGLLYAVLGVVGTYLTSNLGASGLVSTGTAGVIVGIIGIIDHVLSNGTGGLFGSVK